MTDLEIRRMVEEAITNQFREKLRAELPTEHHAIADSTAALDIALGGVFAIDVLKVDNQPLIKLRIEGQVRSIIERLAGTANAFVHALLTATRQCQSDGGIYYTGSLDDYEHARNRYEHNKV